MLNYNKDLGINSAKLYCGLDLQTPSTLHLNELWESEILKIYRVGLIFQ